jgi:archaellum component FlaC|tara:strand:- start:23 stop:271 length:249 start_codon:yes stop_codon:yes gene_type:complete
MMKRKIQAVINRLEDDKGFIKRAIKDWYNEYEEADSNFERMLDTWEISEEMFEIDRKIESAEGYVEGLDEAIKRIKMLKESI